VSLPIHPTAASDNDDRRWQRQPLLLLPLTAASVNDDRHCRHQQQTTATGFW
jgi:hypothetical protein